MKNHGSLSLPSLVVSTVTVLCWDNGCSFLFLLPVSCLCFLCPILWTGSWPLPSPSMPGYVRKTSQHSSLPPITSQNSGSGRLSQPITDLVWLSPGMTIVFSHNRPDTKWQQRNSEWRENDGAPGNALLTLNFKSWEMNRCMSTWSLSKVNALNWKCTMLHNYGWE